MGLSVAGQPQTVYSLGVAELRTPALMARGTGFASCRLRTQPRQRLAACKSMCGSLPACRTVLAGSPRRAWPCNAFSKRSTSLSGRRSRRMVSNDEPGRFTLHRKVAVSRRWGVYGLLNVHANPACHGAHLAHVISYGCARVAALVRPWPEPWSTRVLTSRGRGRESNPHRGAVRHRERKGHVNSRHNPVSCHSYISPEESNLCGPRNAIILPHQNGRLTLHRKVARRHIVRG